MISGVSALDGIEATVSRWARPGHGRDGPAYFIGIGVIDQSLRQATGVGITAGLATLTSNESLEELTAKADAALIEAKRSRGE